MIDADPAAVPGLYEKFAREFDRDRGRGLMERAWLDALLDRLGGRRTVLDLGCGMGEPIARYLINQNCIVTGVDTAPAMIHLCRERFPETTWPEITWPKNTWPKNTWPKNNWIVGDMRAPPVDTRFDAVIAWDSFFFLPPDDQRAMFDVFDRLLGVDGLLLFTSGPEAGEVAGDFEGHPLYHASLDPDEYRSLLTARGLTVLRHRAKDPDCGGHTVWLAQRTPSA